MNSVLVASSVGPGKEYAIPILDASIQQIGLPSLVVMDGVKTEIRSTWSVRLAGRPDRTRIQRISDVREMTRKYFLGASVNVAQGEWTHLFFLDADVIVPACTIEKLLKHKSPIATGIYPLRDFAHIYLPAMTTSSSGKTIFGATHVTLRAQAFGMGCMLIERSVLQSTKFRQGKDLERLGEDYGFCVDSGCEVVVDPTISCWHVHSSGLAGRFAVEAARPGVVWEGSTRYAGNKFGKWVRGDPRYDLTPKQISELGPEFSTGSFVPVHVETAQYADIAKEKI